MEIESTEDWRTLSPNKLQPYNYYYQVPSELKNHISEVTRKVLQGDEPSIQDELSKTLKKTKDATSHEKQAKLYERITHKPVVKTKLKNCHDDQRFEKPSLDVSLTHVRVIE